MIKKILNRVLQKKFDKVGEAALLISLFTFISQILGLLRDRVFASTIGPGEILDIYYASFRVPDFLFAIVGSILSITVLLPFFNEKYQNGENKKEARLFLSETMSGFSIIMISVTLLLMFIFPFLVGFIAPGFSLEAKKQITDLSRIILFSPFILGISNLFSTITQYKKRFIVYGLAPVLYNLGIILGVWLFYPKIGAIGLGFGVILGAGMHLLIQLPTLRHFELVPFFTFKIKWISFLRLLKTSLPRSLGLAMSQFVLLVLTSLATTIAIGSVSVMSLARNLQSVPLSLIGASFSLAAFPLLVQVYKNEKSEYIRQVIIPMKQILFWSLPVSALFIVLRAQIVRVAFGSGLFNWDSTRLTAAVLAIFVLSVSAQGVILLLVRAKYAAGKIWQPVLINFFSSVFSILFAWRGLIFAKNNLDSFGWLANFLRVGSVEGSLVVILPLAFSVGMVLNALILWFTFLRENKLKVGILWTSFYQSIIVSLGVGSVAYIFNNIFVLFFDQNTLFEVFGQGLFSGGLAILAGIGILHILDSQDYKEIRSLVARKIFKYGKKG